MIIDFIGREMRQQCQLNLMTLDEADIFLWTGRAVLCSQNRFLTIHTNGMLFAVLYCKFVSMKGGLPWIMVSYHFSRLL